jgi:hypothetical protein
MIASLLPVLLSPYQTKSAACGKWAVITAQRHSRRHNRRRAHNAHSGDRAHRWFCAPPTGFVWLTVACFLRSIWRARGVVIPATPVAELPRGCGCRGRDAHELGIDRLAAQEGSRELLTPIANPPPLICGYFALKWAPVSGSQPRPRPRNSLKCFVRI